MITMQFSRPQKARRLMLGVIPQCKKTTDMKFKVGKPRGKFDHLGYRKQIVPIVEKAMADFLLRISVNSSYVVLGIHDIASEGFYKHSIAHFLDQIPEHLSFPGEFSPFVS